MAEIKKFNLYIVGTPHTHTHTHTHTRTNTHTHTHTHTLFKRRGIDFTKNPKKRGNGKIAEG